MKQLLTALVGELNILSHDLNTLYCVNREYVLVEGLHNFTIYISQSIQEEDFYHTMENKKHLILRKSKLDEVSKVLNKKFNRINIVDTFTCGDLGYKIQK